MVVLELQQKELLLAISLLSLTVTSQAIRVMIRPFMIITNFLKNSFLKSISLFIL